MADLLGGIGISDDEDKDSPPIPGTPRSPNHVLMKKYELGKLVGHGNFSNVLLARNLSSGEDVAVKVLDKETITKSGFFPRINQELSILRGVRHPNIVNLFEVLATRTKIYIVMEYVDGGELLSNVAKGRLSEQTARRYFHQLISAVSFCHAHGVHHRDLKPENLLLGDKGNLKVSDFGLGIVAEKHRQDGLVHTFCESPGYLAPEVLTRRGYDASKADVWSCGVILFVLMAGHLPFYDKDVAAMYKKIFEGEFRCPRWFSSELVRLLTRILDTDPDTRISIPEIMKDRCFRKGYKNVKFNIESDESSTSSPSGKSSTVSEVLAEYETKRVRSMPRPESLNAFDIISFSSGFDLSGLFEEGEARFISGAPVSKIVSKLEEIAKVVSFTVRKKDYKVSLEGSREGVKGPLTIAAEIIELAPPLVGVKVKKKGGDREEYEDFCNKELRQQLESLIYEKAKEEETEERMYLLSDTE